MSFKAFNLSSSLIEALAKCGYENPSAVQKNIIPRALRGESLLVQSATGTGKTHSFLIPIFEKVDVHLPRVQALVLSPTKELARQTYEFARELGRYFPKFRIRLYTSEDEVTQNLEGSSIPPHLIIGTPGRMKDVLLSRHLFSLQNVRYFILDEADMLLDLGFMNDVEEICRALPSKHSLLVFSATLRQNLRDSLSKFVKEDFRYEAEEIKTSRGVRHHFVDIKHGGIASALRDFLEIKHPYLTLAFASSKEEAEEVSQTLREWGISSILYTGNLEKRERARALRRIREDDCPLIIATDLLARGMDIEHVSDVISLSLPSDLDFYFHRAGRTGRFGKEGDSWVFYNADTLTRAKRLYEEEPSFDFYSLKGKALKQEKKSLFSLRERGTQKKELPIEERKEILIAKARSRKKHVEPMHKKKTQIAIEQVKRKYRRKAIREAIRGQLDKEFRKKDR